MTPPGSESFQFSPLRADLAANCLNILPLITSTTHDTWNDRAIWWTIFHGVEFETKSSERIEGALVTGHFATSRDLYARCLYFPSVNSLEQCSSSRAGGSRTPRTNLSFLFLSPSLSLFLSLSLSFSMSLSIYLSFSCERFKIRPGSRRFGHVPSQGVHHNALVTVLFRLRCSVLRVSRCIRN